MTADAATVSRQARSAVPRPGIPPTHTRSPAIVGHLLDKLGDGVTQQPPGDGRRDG